MYFKDELHRERYEELSKEMHQSDLERKALFYLLATENLYIYKDKIYDFKEQGIWSKCIGEDGSLAGVSSSTKALIRLSFNLFNGYTDERTDPRNIFWSLDEENTKVALEAMRIRFS